MGAGFCAETQKVKAVEEVFCELDHEIESFQQRSLLHCKAGCGKCCFKPDIVATVLEFLPFAYHTHKAGESENLYEKLRTIESTLCVLLNQSSTAGMCGQYPHRGLICRLFGFSARTDKYGNYELVTCQIIKSEQVKEYNNAAAGIAEQKIAVPLMKHQHMKLMAIDAELARNHYPINEAIRKALELVMSYYAYRSIDEA